jgi:tyrosyl-tRNA synthetase
MGFLETMKERGLVAQVTHEAELESHLEAGTRTAYVGFDPTAPSLHVGHLMAIMGLRRWQKAGHRVIALVGGATALVGDPTGKSEMRQMLTAEQVRSNMESIKLQLGRYLDFSSPSRGIMVNNADWTLPLNYMEFLREIGPHFSVNRMLTAECFRARLEKGLSFLEFNYMLLQSYDFLHLYRKERCTVQMGGDDQWSNILAGMELVRRIGAPEAGPSPAHPAQPAQPAHGAQGFCLTFPLLTTSDGRKMGKTEKGAVWLDPEQVSPFEYFQFWRNVDDDRVRFCLAAFTELPMAEVDRLASLPGKEINDAKIVLAYEATVLAHGEEAARGARDRAAQLFKEGGGGGPSGDEPQLEVPKATFGDGMNVLDFLTAAAVVPSKAEAKRLVQQGGLVINGLKVDDVGYKVTADAFQEGGRAQVRKGKKHYYSIRIS